MTQTVAPDSVALQAGVEVWRGGANPWECDEMGHMNVRFHVARAVEGLIGLAAEWGMPHAFSPHAGSTLRVREQHIRFHREVRPPRALHMIGGVVEVGETDAHLLLTLVHTATGQPAASFRLRVSHVTPGDGRAFPWPRAVLERIERLATPLPAYAEPRSVSLAALAPEASMARAEALDLPVAAVGALGLHDCDVFGRMNVEGFIARITSGAGSLTEALWSRIIDHDPSPSRLGVAGLEYRMVHLDWPRPGDRLVVRSGLSRVDHRAVRIAHWVLDPDTGKAWGVAEAVIAPLDLDARKLVKIGAASQAALAKMIIPGLIA